MKPIHILSTLTLGIALGGLGLAVLQHYQPDLLARYSATLNESSEPAANNTTAERQPLYWVAPMDANYRRDQPGKSPMGMDLVPFYGDDEAVGQGVVKISPELSHNLGVRTTLAEQKPLATVLDTVGFVRINEHQITHIHPRVQGWMEKLQIKAIGDSVNKGEELYDIYSPELVNAQEELMLAIERNNARLITAASERLKALQLNEQQISKLKSTKKVEQTITIYAQQKGVIDQLNIAQGFYVKPDTSMMAIVDLSTVWVEAQLFERQAAFVQNGMHAFMSQSTNPALTWQGKVDYVYPKLDANNRSLTLRIKVDNADGYLRPNMFMQVALTPAESQLNAAVVQIPTAALIRTGKQNRVVLALDEGKFKSVAVQIGRISNNMVEILSGIAAGDKIVTSAQFLLDSESSKTSDFQRLDGVNISQEPSKTTPVNNQIATLKVKVNQLNGQTINVDHPAIEQWQWPAMTMDFKLDEQLRAEQFPIGAEVKVDITKVDKRTYVITKVYAQNDAPALETVMVMATFNRIDATQGIANVDHPPIEQWRWPAMTMDFKLDATLDLEQISAGQQAHIQITKVDKRTYVITQIHLMSAGAL